MELPTEIVSHIVRDLPTEIVSHIVMFGRPTRPYLEELDNFNEEYHNSTLMLSIGRVVQYLNTDIDDYELPDELPDDFECSGRACGNMSCCLGWSECEVENTRFFDNDH